MKKMYLFVGFLFLIMIHFGVQLKPPFSVGFKEKLSDYSFFEGNIAAQKPATGVMPYQLNAPLFSDYAHKLRFVQLPDNQQVTYNPDSVFQFPKGTAIIKTFYYKKDERDAKKGRQLMETRVLLHEENGWIALPYVWNEAQTDAFLEITGGTTQVAWRDANGSKKGLEYSIPNMNQCKGCHERNGEISPIGVSARQLNGDFKYADSIDNQLVQWNKKHLLTALPDLKTVPKLVNYEDVTARIDDRARAYLDINCAHCHQKTGAAQTSGLFLDWQTKDSTAYGFYKTPIAAGRGSGNLKFDIVAGKPQESILLYRMESLDPGEMMPELGRQMQHVEGIKLIKAWIASLNSSF